MIPLFTATLLLSSFLLFLIQPMVAKMILPILGGSPSVWNTSMVFFQSALLCGYAYVHFATVRLGPRKHAVVHVAIALLSLSVLPIAIPNSWNLPGTSDPALWLLGVLVVIAGLPFFLVASTAPLLQRWFAQSSHAYADDPYFLYRASNVGSIAALLGYPFLVEPHISLARQTHLWAGGYVLLVGLVAVCGVAALMRARKADLGGVDVGLPATEVEEDVVAAQPSLGDRLLWIALAFVPSSLMLGVTSYLTTDVAAVPLLWVVPLTLYLLTFVLVFGRRPFRWMTFFYKALPILVSVFVLVRILRIDSPVAVLVAIHLITFFVAAIVCHGRLAARRPPARYLTHFYLYLAMGGVLGGAFNALVAPQIFTSFAEYPLAVVAACALIPWGPRSDGISRARFLGVVLVLALALALFAGRALVPSADASLPLLLLYLTLGILLPISIVFSWRKRPAHFAAGIAALLVAGGPAIGREPVLAVRTFFGLHTVSASSEGEFIHLLHGTTVHGTQSSDPSRIREPLSYYHATGPIGQLFGTLQDEGRLSVGVIGLGAGTIGCYAQPGERWTFYEIDPAIVGIAEDRRLFTYLSDCMDHYEVVLGDARISISSAPSATYDLLIMDAFSSDSIPIHLVTKEALDLYKAKLAPNGLLVFNITNRYIDLTPVLAGLAEAGELVGVVQRDRNISPELSTQGKTASDWAVLARHEEDLEELMLDPRWEPLREGSARLWTDDFSDLLGVLRWR